MVPAGPTGQPDESLSAGSGSSCTDVRVTPLYGGGLLWRQGDDRNRTGVDGFAGRCVTTPPRRHEAPLAYRAEAASSALYRAIRALYQLLGRPLAALWDIVSPSTAIAHTMEPPKESEVSP